MSDPFEGHLDVMQNIEAAIIMVYDEHADLSDYNVDKALQTLIRIYQAENREKPAPTLRFRELEQQVYDAVHTACESRLGRGDHPLPGDVKPITIDEIVACLKRVRKSIALWTKEGGRQGYLHYIDQFL